MTTPSEYLTTKEISEVSGLSRNTIKKYRATKSMPEPDHFFNRTPVWKAERIDDWINTRKKSSKED
jgi:predicted DNA-binding transcriptional regulator AlpA